jgi:hypothetical protein
MGVVVVNNMELRPEDKTVIISVNPKLYPLDLVCAAAGLFAERAHVTIDGDPKQEILVELRPKDDCALELLGREFNSELILNAAGRVCSRNLTDQTPRGRVMELPCEVEDG